MATAYAIELRGDDAEFVTIHSMSNHLATAYPRLAARLPRTRLADLPTPLVERPVATRAGNRRVAIKCDDRTGRLYGGNKVRKLEYLLFRAADRCAQRVATFGTVASNHALATTLYARSVGLACTCFLSHQTRTANAPRVLNLHLQNHTELVPYGGSYAQRVGLLRTHLWNRRAWVIPAGGSSWLGAVGFVNAGLELAAQIEAGEVSLPDRLYVANGTMGTAVGLALGLALAALPIEVQAVQVTEDFIASPGRMRRLLLKTAAMLHALDPAVPADLADRARYRFRCGFLGDGYAKSNPATERAVGIARDELGLSLEATYTGKAMAAMLYDLDQKHCAGQSMLFWNTYNSQPLPASADKPDDVSQLPEEFLRYFAVTRAPTRLQ